MYFIQQAIQKTHNWYFTESLEIIQKNLNILNSNSMTRYDKESLRIRVTKGWIRFFYQRWLCWDAYLTPSGEHLTGLTVINVDCILSVPLKGDLGKWVRRDAEFKKEKRLFRHDIAPVRHVRQASWTFM